MADLADLITTAQAADRIGVTVATINLWATLGKLVPAHQLPGKTGTRLYRVSDVEARRADREGATA